MRERELKRKSSHPTLRSGSKQGGGSKTSFLRSGGGGRVFLRCESLREERGDSGGKRGVEEEEERPRKGVIFHVRSSALCLGYTSVVRSTRPGPARLFSSQFPLPARGGSGLELAPCLEALPGCPSPSTSFSLASSFTVPLIFVFLLGKYELASSSSLRFHFLAGWGRKCETAMSEKLRTIALSPNLRRKSSGNERRRTNESGK